MPLWGIKYMDVDERWWVDLVIQERAPDVASIVIGGREYCDGFKVLDGRVVVRRASIQPADLPDWPADSPVMVGPARHA